MIAVITAYLAGMAYGSQVWLMYRRYGLCIAGMVYVSQVWLMYQQLSFHDFTCSIYCAPLLFVWCAVLSRSVEWPGQTSRVAWVGQLSALGRPVEWPGQVS